MTYARFTFSGNISYEADGTSHNIPLSLLDIKPIDKGIKRYSQDITLDAKGNPVVLYSRYDEMGQDGAKLAWWDGENWKIETLGANLNKWTQRFAHYPQGGITICAGTSSEINLLQKQTINSEWVIRTLCEQNPVHPVIEVDLIGNQYHVFWHTTDGKVWYQRSSGLDLSKNQ